MTINAQVLNVFVLDRDGRSIGNALVECFSDGKRVGTSTTKSYADSPVTLTLEAKYEMVTLRATFESITQEATVDLKQNRNHTFHFNNVQIGPPPSSPSSPAGESPSKGTGGTGHTNLLVKLGKIAGIGGIGVGTFLILLRAFVFPTLAATQASLVMFLSYGIAVVGLIIWAAQATTHRYLPILLAVFAIAMAWIGRTALRPGDLPYNVRVTVLNPDHIPVNDAHVWSTLGGETKQVKGGWEIAIPPADTKEKRKVTIYAEVASQGWRGNVDLPLEGEHSPAVSVQLRTSGELPVRGFVRDSRRNAVPNAIVSVVGYGNEARPTDANGGFELPSHKKEGDKVQLHAEKAPYVPADIPDYIVGSNPVILILEDANKTKTEVRPKPPSPPHVDLTGDSVIDRVLADLATLKRLQRPPTEAKLAETLAPLFSRPAFYPGNPEEDWRYFLYALCRTRLLLEEYLGQFKSKPDVAKKINEAIGKMVRLQDEVAILFGPTFSATEHIGHYIQNRNAFIDNLPPIVENPTPEKFETRDREIREIRELLRKAGFPIRE